MKPFVGDLVLWKPLYFRDGTRWHIGTILSTTRQLVINNLSHPKLDATLSRSIQTQYGKYVLYYSPLARILTGAK